jgi:hypothetical protein
MIKACSQALKHRILWSWDSFLCDRNEKSFLENYKNLVNFMADHNLTGVIIWGFLDDQHGGEDAAHELSEYASKKSVRILPGVGALIYKGVYCEGDHEFSLKTHLRKHPELKAVNWQGEPTKREGGWGCPSKKENITWMKRGVEWLFKNFNPGGVNFEGFEGAYGMCWCDDCQKISKSVGATHPDIFKKPNPIMHKAMMLWKSKVLSPLIETVKRVSPDALITYATYTPYWTAKYPPEIISLIPEYAFAQWTVTGFYDTFDPPEGAKPPTKHNIGLGYYFSGTHFDRPFTKRTYSYGGHFFDWSFRRFHPYVLKLKKLCESCAEQGFEGAMIHGTGLPTAPDNEINYIGLEEFASNPDMSLDDFWSKHLPSLYGGDVVDEVKEVMVSAEEYEPLYIKYYNWLGKPLFWYPDPGKIVWKNELSTKDWRAMSQDWQSLSQKTKTNLQTAKKAIKQANKKGKNRLEKIITLLTEYHVFTSQLYPAARPFLEAENKAYSLIKKAESLLNQKKKSEALSLYRSAHQIKNQNKPKIEAVSKLLEKQPVNQKIYKPKKIKEKYQKTVKDLSNQIKSL